MLRKNLKPLCLTSMVHLGLLGVIPAHAQDGVTAQLVSQGNYWHDQGRDDLASDTWNKLLSIDPNQPDALLGLGQIALFKGRTADVKKFLERLQRTHPNSPQLQRLRSDFSGRGEDENLRAARSAASAGRYAEAVRAYELVFGGSTPLPRYALEYYQCLAGTATGWERARLGLSQLHATEPNDPAVSLALAQILTYRESSRREGIAQLSRLSKYPGLAGAARASWRQALLWLSANQADLPLYQAFLTANPNDVEIAAKLSQLRGQRGNTADPGGPMLGEAFKALGDGNLVDAEQRFTQVLHIHPGDADALGGMGSVRLRQQRFPEAQELLRQAAASSSKWKPAYDSARYWQQLQQAQTLHNRGDDSQARHLVEQSIHLLPNEAAGYAVLGGLQADSDAAAAEASYRKALSLDGGNSGAIQGLVALYSRQGRMQEANELFSRLSPADQAKEGGVATLRSNVERARARRALEQGDIANAQSLLEAAMVEQPGDPWIRLDLARLYQQAGRPDQARSVMDGLLAVHGDMPVALYANALLAQDGGDWATVYSSLERIPPASRDAQMTQLHTVAWLEMQAHQATLLVQQGRAGEAQLLISRAESALGDQLDSSALLAALAGAYADVGNLQRALTLAQRLLAGPSPTMENRLQYASVLLRAHQDAELSAVLRQIQGLTMTPEQMRRYQSLRRSYVLRQVDALRGLGNLEGAYVVLSPILAQTPNDRDALNALARMYTTAGDLRQAGVIYQRVLQSSPDNLDTLVAAANNAAASKDLDNADAYMDRALKLAPESPDTLAAAARVYRAEGKKRRAEKFFKAALVAQQRQAGELDNGFPMANGGNPFSTADRSFNPFAGITGPMRNNAAVLSDTTAAPVAYAGNVSAIAAQGPSVAIPAATSTSGAVSSPNASDDLPPPIAASTVGNRWPIPGQDSGVRAPPDAPFTTLVVSAPSVPAAESVAKQTLPPVTSGNPVLDELRQLQSDNSGELDALADYRSRDGEAGLGKLDEIQTVLKGKFPVGEGKLEVDLTPTVVDAGQVSTDYATASRFGAGPVAALDDGLAADTSIVGDYVSGSLYQLLMTEGNTTASQTLFYKYAVSTGLYSELYTTYGSDSATKAAIYQQPLFAYLLSIDAATTPISEIATAILSNSSLYNDLTTADLSSLKALASSSEAASMSATDLKTALYAMQTSGSASRRLNQDATGVGLSINYANGGFRGDIGSTPMGFPEQNVVGGAGYKGQIGDFNYDAQIYRRAVTDSVLSYAGAKDSRGDMQWGGVTSNGARVAGTVDNGLLGGYVNLAAAKLLGHDVQSNNYAQADVGFYVHALETANQSLTAGLNLTAMRYEHNLAGYTYGQGGYFSPQQYFDLGFPVHWSGRSSSQKVNWKLDASVGVQYFKTDDSVYFPTDESLQQSAYEAASLAALLGLASTYTAPVYQGESKTGVSYNLTGAAEWQVAPQLFVGGRLIVNNARDYNQFNIGLYLRFVLDRLGATMGREPTVVASPYAQ